MDIKGKDISIWIDTTSQTDFPALEAGITTDVVIVGGGIVGITCAYLLSKKGLDIVLIDKKRIVEKTTGHTTAKVTSSHQLIYKYLTEKFGRDTAYLYGQANESAVKEVIHIALEENLNCDLIPKSSFLFGTSESDKAKIEEEYRVAKELELPVQFLDKVDLPFPSFGALEFTGQAQFHPRKYLLGLVDVMVKAGVKIFENTEVKKVENGEVGTDKGNVKAKHIVAASHVPFFDKEIFKKKMSRSRDYSIAIKMAGEKPDGMFISAGENYHSIRTQVARGEELLIIDGGWHQIDDREIEDPQNYLNLQKWAGENFEVLEFVYYWSTYDWDSPDRIPLAGQYRNNLYIATGFGGWGMSNGTASAMLVSDLISGASNPFTELYDPTRD